MILENNIEKVHVLSLYWTILLLDICVYDLIIFKCLYLEHPFAWNNNLNETKTPACSFREDDRKMQL